MRSSDPYALVALPLPVDTLYTYDIPAELSGQVTVGSGVVVPFGRKVLTGVVVDTARETELKKTRSVLDVINNEPVLSAEQLELTRWIAEYYLCSWGEAIRAILPPGIDSSSQLRIERIPDVMPQGTLSDRQRHVLSVLSSDGTLAFNALRKSVPGLTRLDIRRLSSQGLVRTSNVVRGPRTKALEETLVRLSNEPSIDPPRGIRQQAVLQLLVEADEDVTQGEIIRKTGSSSSTIRRLEELGYVETFRQRVDRSRNRLADVSTVHVGELRPAQTEALDRISKSVSDGSYATFLLHGVTGSGKTEVYIRALREARDRGCSAIILVPEISLTPQTVRRFRSHFGDEIAVMHSRMSPGERFDAWTGIRAGRYPIVIGPRSAVFAPVSNLGLIIVDEEHEPSYKQFEPAPRYHARDVAVFRARKNNAVCVLGSATPSLESLSNARSGKYGMLSMPDRIPRTSGESVLPTVRIVDLRSAENYIEPGTALSPALISAIKERLERKEQVILLQNRRGYAPYVACSTCGWSLECEDCSVSMTFHKTRSHLRCHYCGRTSKLPRACPKCGNTTLLQSGVGTQRVEEELIDRLPGARILRMDFDTTSKKDAHHKILDLFGRGEADILLGTQMVAKGLDFGRVTLVGVVNADTGLYFPDIRAEERSFQLLTQVAGRAGRADLVGEVILQTRQPGHRVIQYALQHDYNRFAAAALPEREMLGYPPAGRMIACLFTGPDEQRVLSISRRWARTLSEIAPMFDVLGPSPSFVGKIRRQFRTQVVIKIDPSKSPARARAAIRETNIEFGTLPTGYRMAVDVDPVSTL